MPDIKELQTVSQSPALIALVCLASLAFVVWAVLRWAGRLIETKLMPLGGDALDAMKNFLGHLRTNQEALKVSQDAGNSGQAKLLENQLKIKEMNDSTRQHLEKLVAISAEQSKALAEIAKASASIPINVTALQENGKTLDSILAALNKVCKYNEEAIRNAVGFCPMHPADGPKKDETRSAKSA